MDIVKRHARILGTPVLLALLTSVALSQVSRPANDAPALEVRRPIERGITTGEVHRYSVRMTAGQVLDAIVDQHGVDIVVDVWAPDGRKVMEVDSPNGADGPEPVLLIAEDTGIYILQVRALEKGASGRYAMTFNGQRPPTDDDRKHFEDLAKLAEAQQIENRWFPLYSSGHYSEAIPLAERVLTIRRSVLGPNHPDVARTLNSLASLCQNNQDFARAESLFRQSLSIDEIVFGKDHPNLAIAYGNLATLYYDVGDYGQSEALMKKALALREEAFGSEHPDVALTLHNLARLYQAKGNLVGADEFCRRALEIYQKVRSADHPDIARSLGTLAELYRLRGDFAHAEPLYQQALVIYQKWGSRGEFWAASVTTGFATMYLERGNYDKAIQLFHSALATYEKSLGKEHNDVAQVLNNLAVTYESKGEYDRAEELHQRSLAIRNKLFGPDALQYAESISNLAQIYRHKHNFELARAFSQQALAIWEKTLGMHHPNVATAYSNLAIQQGETGDIAGGVKSLKRVNEIEEHNLKLILTTGSEDQKQIYLNKLSGNAEYTVSLNVRYARDNEEATRLALTSILQRKGRALDAMSDQIGNLRRRANFEDAALLDRLEKVRSQLSALQISVGGKLKPQDKAAEISKLEIENERIEASISKRSDEFRAQFQSTDIEAVRRALPSKTALVEFVLFRAFDVERRGVIGEQYAAYVIRSESSTPLLVSLGDASSIDGQIQSWRLALSDPKRVDVKTLGRTLDERVMRPVRKVLGSARHVFVSTDGALNLVPFTALVDESNRYLVENYSITYLTSGRDLLRFQSPHNDQAGNVVIVADPLFDLASAQGNGSTYVSQSQSARPFVKSRRSVDFATMDYQPLLGTAAEARALSRLWPSATVWSGERATEAAIKQVKKPRILHVATHGFFLPNKPPTEKTKGPSTSFRSASPDSLSNQENPLLRSGLILAGVKQQQSGEGEDGVLSALEVAGLNLWGTKLVVLSACETGLGDVKRGEGLYGLRRALVLAGSESQLISLWKVSDAGTRDLMTAYYTSIQNHQGRTEALREVQMAMLGGKLTSSTALQSGQRETTDVGEKNVAKNYRHPYYWAAFIQSGDWRNMEGR